MKKFGFAEWVRALSCLVHGSANSSCSRRVGKTRSGFAAKQGEKEFEKRVNRGELLAFYSMPCRNVTTDQVK